MVRKLKHTEIGDIPVDWELQTFDETFRVISNNTLSRENLNNRGGAVRNIHYGDILTKFPEVLDCSEDEIPFVNDLSLLSSSTQLLQDGDIVVADTAEDETVGKVIEVQNLGDSKPHMGLTTWAAASEGKIVKSDVSVAKNYLSEKEMRSLERIVSAYLDLAEDRAERHIPMTMEDWAKRLDLFLMADDREVLQDTGKITAEIAKAKAETEFEKYRVIQDRLFMSDFDKYMLELEENAKK